MEITNGELLLDGNDLYEVQVMLQQKIDLNGCIESLFIINGLKPEYVNNVKLSYEPNEKQKQNVEVLLEKIKTFIQSKKKL